MEQFFESVGQWFTGIFAKFSEFGTGALITVFALVALAVVLMLITGKRNTFTARGIAYGAISIALSFVLSFIRLFRMPNGGSITPASMLPLLIYAAAYGTRPGIACGMAYGVLQFIQGGEMFHPVEFILDFLLAFAFLGLAGIRFPKKWQVWGILCAMVCGILGRCLCATLAGYFVWGETLWASFIYNISYLGPDGAICLLLAVPLAPRLIKMMRSAGSK